MTLANCHEMGQACAADGRLNSLRAESVLAAVKSNSDFTLLEVRSAAPDGVAMDVFVVACVSDGVPSQNRVGIQYEEPLAIMVSSDPAALPQVRALRRNFPITAHQNAVPDGEACSLCLYDQVPVAVLRTWTAPAFLRKIQWWLAETAHERLHQADQPLEQLFFDSPNEIILPARYLAAPENANKPLIVTDVVERHDSSDTQREHPAYSLFLEPPRGRVRANATIRMIPITLPPITHGIIEREPSTLGALEDQLRARGASVMDPLLDHIKQYVGQGRNAEDQYKATVLLLITPLQRAHDGPVERLQARAFWVNVDMLGIGESAGAVIRTNDRSPCYFIDYRLQGTPPNNNWRALNLTPLTVLTLPDAEAARHMSGVTQIGPRGVVAGAGALGSSMLDLWRRAGWGEWSVIDRDHLQPHNVIRHTARFLGHSKAHAVAAHDAELWRAREPRIQAIAGDAGDLKDPVVRSALQGAELIVDTTTTLEVPRRLANVDLSGRVVSGFLTPAGTDAVLIAEDRERRLRIDVLEPQYWRAVLTETWGETHLTNAFVQFRSGGSCRDISLVIPYSAILAHAATLAEQIQRLPGDAVIRVWQRDRVRGSVAVHDVPIREPLLETFPGMTVVWDRGILAKVKALRQAALPAETGGVLVGYHDLNERRIYVVDALSAPPDSVGTLESFERGVQGLRMRITEIGLRSAGQICYLGEWHSHPKGHDARQSDQDLRQLLYLGDLLGGEDLPALMLIVAEADHRWLITL